MRFTRVVSLVAGITLVVTGCFSLLGRRDEVGRARDRGLAVSAELVAVRFDATIARVTVALAVSMPDTSVEQLADALAMPVCEVITSRGRGGQGDGSPSGIGPVTCSSTSPDRGLAGAVAAAAGRPAPVVIAEAGDGEAPAGAVVASDQGARTIVVAVTLDRGGVPDPTSVDLVPVDATSLLRARTVDSMRSYAAPSMVEFDDGPWAVRTTTDATVRLTAGERWLIGAQLLVGAVLAAVALGGTVAEHRSLQRRATTDGLTGLPNRAEFERRAAESLLRLARDGGAACLLVVDLDRFKAVNDTVGHEAGDRMLVAMAVRLRAAVRRTDLVGRWGGDEFVVLLPGIAEAASVADRVTAIAEAIAAGPPIGGRELSASIGAALFPTDGTSLEALMRTADRAMYAAKVQA